MLQEDMSVTRSLLAFAKNSGALKLKSGAALCAAVLLLFENKNFNASLALLADQIDVAASDACKLM
jgi:hypothetical protein